MFDEYKEKYKFSYTDDEGNDMYFYHTRQLTLEQIHMCETNYMTRACIVYDGHTCIELTRAHRYWHITEEGEFTKLTFIDDESLTHIGYKCIDPDGKPHLYCI